MTTDRVTVTTLVSAHPERAFAAFTDGIDAWWRRAPRHRQAPASSIVRFADGMLVEVTESGAVELGRVLAWEPGKRLVLEWLGPTWAPAEQTEVEVRFDLEGSATRVTIEHRGWSDLRPGDAASSVIGLWWGDLLAGYTYQTSRS